jgi:hypothetical protein
MPTLNDNLEKQDFILGGLQIWIHGRQYPDKTDYWDGNWLVVTIHCGSSSSDVWVKNEPALHLSQLKQWMIQLDLLSNAKEKEITFDDIEPYLKMNLKMEADNSFKFMVEVAPCSIGKTYTYLFSLCKNDIEQAVSDLRKISMNYPLIGKASL